MDAGHCEGFTLHPLPSADEGSSLIEFCGEKTQNRGATALCVTGSSGNRKDRGSRKDSAALTRPVKPWLGLWEQQLDVCCTPGPFPFIGLLLEDYLVMAARAGCPPTLDCRRKR